MLKIEDINVYYGKIHALKNVSFAVQEGEVVALIGANGAGKSTTLKTISGMTTNYRQLKTIYAPDGGNRHRGAGPLRCPGTDSGSGRRHCAPRRPGVAAPSYGHRRPGHLPSGKGAVAG